MHARYFACISCPFQTFLYIIAAWSAPNSLKHTTHEQHVYVCKAILVCTGLLTGR
jgi:hypothetical protein